MEKSNMQTIGEVTTIILATMISIIISGLVLQKLWLWFITPFGLIPLSLAHAEGLYTIAVFLRSGNGSKGNGVKEVLICFVQSTFITLGFLPIGWIISISLSA